MRRWSWFTPWQVFGVLTAACVLGTVLWWEFVPTHVQAAMILFSVLAASLWFRAWFPGRRGRP